MKIPNGYMLHRYEVLIDFQTNWQNMSPCVSLQFAALPVCLPVIEQSKPGVRAATAGLCNAFSIMYKDFAANLIAYKTVCLMAQVIGVICLWLVSSSNKVILSSQLFRLKPNYVTFAE